MASIVTRYTVKLVKEESHRYEVGTHLNSPYDVVDFLTKVVKIHENAEEVLILIALDTKNKTIGWFEVARGSINSAVVNPREVFKRAILCNSASIMIAHNHPSGNVTPSQEDIAITKRMFECGKILDIKLLDHLIIGESYTSLKEEGII